MTSELWQQIQEILGEALEKSTADRMAFVADACGGNQELLKEVKSLLLSADDAAKFIEKPFVSLGEEGRDFAAGDTIGSFRIVREIGRGGMGVVYEAVRADQDFDLRVALKIVTRAGRFDEFLHRIRRERKILAGLDHPNVAKLIDGGSTEDGRPYFAMEYIDGEPIDKYCDNKRLDLTARVALFREVCSAVAYAHQNLVVHRDLKPGNILVSADGKPKLLDFGIAKFVDAGTIAADATTLVSLTDPSSQPMTLAYASPEQIRSEAIATTSDVYSLGVLLYEILTGHSPYRVTPRTVRRVRKAVEEQEPKKLSAVVGTTEEIETSGGHLIQINPNQVSRSRRSDLQMLQRRLRGDLDCIVLKALRKEPENRYSSVEKLSDDLHHYLEGLPVSARRGTFIYRATKFVQRQRAPLTLLAAALTLALVVLSMHRYQARSEQELADNIIHLVEMANLSGNDPKTLARDLRERLLLIGDRATFAQVLDERAMQYREQGDFGTAEILFREGLSMWRRLEGDEHEEVMVSQNLLASSLGAQGKFAEAETLYLESLAVRQKESGRQSEDVARILNNLAVLFQNSDRLEEAEKLILESLAIGQQIYPAGDIEIAAAHNNLGIQYMLQGKLSAAEKQYLTGLNMVVGGPSGKAAHIRRNLAMLYIEMGRLEEAEVLALEALSTFRGRELHWQIAYSESVLGGCLFAQGRYKEAEPLIKWSYPVIRTAMGDGARQTREAKRRLEEAQRIKASEDRVRPAGEGTAVAKPSS